MKKQRMIFVETESGTQTFSIDDELIIFENGELTTKETIAQIVDDAYDGKWEQFKVVDEENFERVYQKFDRARE